MGNSRDKKLYNKTKHTITGWMNTMHKRMQQRNRAKFAQDLPFDRWGFESWVLEKQLDRFIDLFKAWQESQYFTDLKPSVDRIDFTKPYSFDNMQIITWDENNTKGNIEKRQIGVDHMTKVTKRAVNKYDLDGKFICSYESLSEASRANNISTSIICECCKGKRKTGKGFRWTYA